MARLDTALDILDGCSAMTLTAETYFDLGLRCAAGREGDVDLIEAHKWFNLAALRGHEEARQYRAEISRDLTRTDIAKAQRLAREYLARLH